MSIAAVEMKHPPAQLRVGGWLLVAAFVSPFVAIPFIERDHANVVVALSYILFYLPACAFLGVAAHKMHRSWLIYGAAAAVLGYGGGLMSFMFLKYWRQSGAKRVA
jgi:hypothetical protein